MSTRSTMQALSYDRFGGMECTRLQTVDRPAPTRGDVLVRVRAAGLNPIDYKLRNGLRRWVGGGPKPYGIGVDFAGVVEVCGADTGSLVPGAEVWGWVPYARSGSFAEYVVAPADLTVPKPEGLSFEQAGGLAMVGCTACDLLIAKGGLKAGQRVLVNGCTGGVGHIVLQVAKRLGAVVHGVCAGPEKEVALRLGADAVIDFRETDVRELPDRYDRIIETSGKLSYAAARHLLVPSGRYLTTIPAFSQFAARLLNPFRGRKNLMVMSKGQRVWLERLNNWATAGEIEVVVGRTWPFEQALEALAAFERGTAPVAGKQVLVFAEQRVSTD